MTKMDTSFQQLFHCYVSHGISSCLVVDLPPFEQYSLLTVRYGTTGQTRRVSSAKSGVFVTFNAIFIKKNKDANSKISWVPGKNKKMSANTFTWDEKIFSNFKIKL